jgi:membrane protease subunit (stomatin/prohibitin family)
VALIDVVKWDDPKDMLAWRFPNTELSTMSRVLVNESQEALLFRGGKLLQRFGPGDHTLSTENIPLLSKLVNLPFGGKSPFSAEVWFVNRAVSLDVNWGTTDPVQVEDPKYGIIVPVRAFGQFGLRVADPALFVTQLVGAAPSFTRTELASHFKGLLMTRLKSAIAQAIVLHGVSILEISTELQALSERVEGEVVADVRAYGVEMLAFRILSISVPADDESLNVLKHAKATAARRRIEGTSYPQERSYDVVEGAARNAGGGGGIAGTAINLGIGLAAAKAVSGMMEGVTANLAPPLFQPGDPAAAATSSAYFLHVNGKQEGPVPLAKVQEKISSGDVSASTPIWRDGLAQWVTAGDLPEFRALLPPPFAPPPA